MQAMLDNNEWNKEYICDPNSIEWVESQEPNGMYEHALFV